MFSSNSNLLFEMSLAVGGEFDFGEFSRHFDKRFMAIFNLRKNILFKDNFKLKDGKNYKVIAETDGHFIFIKNLETEELMAVIEVITKVLKKNLSTKYENVLMIKSVKTDDKFKNKGLMKLVYLYLLSLNYSLMGDAIEYESARGLWVSLQGFQTFKTDIIDIDNDKIIYKNIKLKDINDERVWKIIDPLDLNHLDHSFKELYWIWVRLIMYK